MYSFKRPSMWGEFPESTNTRPYGLNHRINLNFVYREMQAEAIEESEE